MKKIFVCLPGDSFTGGFLDSWTRFLIELLMRRKYEVIVSRAYSAFVCASRLRCLGGDGKHGEHQSPFQGMDYDFILWIDSDISWEFADFANLMETHERTGAGVVTGLYLMRDGKQFPAVERWQPEVLETAPKMPFLTPETVKGRDAFEVAYNGLGFALVAKGVYEAIPYPWFEPRRVEGRYTYGSEDVSFCRDCADHGIKVLVDPRVIVGHEKTVMLKP